MAAVDVAVLEELGELIEDLTTTGKPSLDEKQIKRVKNICKTSNSYVNHAYHILITQLKKKHSEIRFSCFQIIQELFSRSHVFRELILGEFQVFMELVIGVDSNIPLPPPLKTAKTLKEKGVEAVESWHQKYGSHYKKLDLGYQYLKRIKHIEFDAIRTRSLAERRQAEEREKRRQKILQKKIDKAENEIAEQTGHIELCLTEINNCFKLLLPHPDDYEVHCLELEKEDITHQITTGNDLDTPGKKDGKEKSLTNMTSNTNSNSTNDTDIECDGSNQEDTGTKENQREDLVKDHGLGSRSYEINLEVNTFQPTVDETEDNTIIINTVREMNKEITHKYLPMINQWLQVFTKAGHSHQRILSVIDLKRQLQSAKDKFNELNISPIKLGNKEENNSCDDDDDNDEDEFLDVPEKEGIEYIPENKMAEYGLESILQNKSSANVTSRQNDSLKHEESFLKQYGFSIKDAEDPTSHARAILEARKKQRSTDLKGNQADSSTTTSYIPTIGSSSLVESEKRSKLLEKAPVVPFDMDLYHWEDPNYDPPKIIRSDNFNNFWANSDMEAEQLFKEDKGSMLKRRITFGGKFEPVKWACHAPLPNGKLCPRKDRIKCPFHGLIVARDDKGNPVGERNIDTSAPSTSTSLSQATSTEDWKDIQQDIEAATGLDLGKNVKKRKGQKRKSGTSEKELSRKQKYSRLTDIHKSTKTPRSRLERKVLSRDSMKRVAEEMDNLATKRFLDKFGDQFNYQLRK
ncbi:UV-stimulated scaffold protein A-like [Actinia tenebrosa]|uniref:UV-stimulated scaffold protein A-like n=1 Tax=Actinia tenebrosa TaxID=6105 RepID=A0A6P8IYE7_ACTTE|nr:UV-stimulated scaffold protein A-like [Actinia tenebrosa]